MSRSDPRETALLIRAEREARTQLETEEFQRQVVLARERLLAAARRRTLWQRVLDALPFTITMKTRTL